MMRKEPTFIKLLYKEIRRAGDNIGMKKIPFYSFSSFTFVLFLFLLSQTAFAIDLGGTTSEDDKPQKVEIINEEPVKIKDSSEGELKTITSGSQLKPLEDFESPYIDVREYKTVAVYVLPEKKLNDSVDIRYKVDAFFAVAADSAEYKKFGDKSQNLYGEGSQEFGHIHVEETGGKEIPSFTKTTTGETTSRVLYSPVFGPFMRVKVRNLDSGETRKFQIVAYLSK